MHGHANLSEVDRPVCGRGQAQQPNLYGGQRESPRSIPSPLLRAGMPADEAPVSVT